MIEIVALIVSIPVGALLVAALLKLVFKLHRRANVAWKNAWICGVMLLLIGMFFGTFANVFADSPLQYVMYAIGFATQIVVTSLFLGKRASDPEHGPVGARKAASSMALLMAVMLLLSFLFHALLPVAPQ